MDVLSHCYNTRLDFLCKYTVDNLEFLDSPVHIATCTCGDHAIIQDYMTVLIGRA